MTRGSNTVRTDPPTCSSTRQTCTPSLTAASCLMCMPTTRPNSASTCLERSSGDAICASIGPSCPGPDFGSSTSRNGSGPTSGREAACTRETWRIAGTEEGEHGDEWPEGAFTRATAPIRPIDEAEARDPLHCVGPCGRTLPLLQQGTDGRLPGGPRGCELRLRRAHRRGDCDWAEGRSHRQSPARGRSVEPDAAVPHAPQDDRCGSC